MTEVFFVLSVGVVSSLFWFLISKYHSKFSYTIRILIVIPYLIIIITSIVSIQMIIGALGMIIWEEPDIEGNIFWFRYIIGPFCTTYISLSESSKLLPNVREPFVSFIGGFVCLFYILGEVFNKSYKGLGFILLITSLLLGFYFAHKASRD